MVYLVIPDNDTTFRFLSALFFSTVFSTLTRQAGQFISVYDMERTLVECLRTAYHVDIQVIAPAFQAYFKKGAVDYAKLYHYAQLFKVTEKLQSYVEVLS